MTTSLNIALPGPKDSLPGWALNPSQIGDKKYSGGSEFVEVVDVTYQQKSHTSGYISETRGFTYNGYGLVGGGGGIVSTTHENVATVIVRDRHGQEKQYEFPAELAARNTAILRLDTVGQNVVAVRNITGKCGPIALLNEHDFYPSTRLRKTFIILAIIGWLLSANGLSGLITGVLLASPMGLWVYRSMSSTVMRRKMKNFISDVISQPNSDRFERTDARLERN